MKRKRVRFDTLVARYYPAVYSFASRLTDDPREAVLLTHEARESNYGTAVMRSSL
jgi:plasmid replication initiation protein